MRAESGPAALAAVIVLSLLTAHSSAFAAGGNAPAEANEADPRGDWINAPEAAVPGLKLALHIRGTLGDVTGAFDAPDHGAFGVPIAHVEAHGQALGFDVPLASGRYVGVWSATQRAYVGQWTSPYGSGPLSLIRGTLPAPAPADWSVPADPGLAYTPGPAARARVGPTLAVGKCVNMANMLEAPREGDWGPSIADDDFRIIKVAGFATVRVPVSWSTHAGATAPYAIDPAFLARVHHVVALATAAGLNVILNVHHDNELTSDPAGQAARFTALWRQIAASFAGAPPTVWFELINEPHDKLTDANLTPVLSSALAAVRATNPTRPVLIGGQNWSSLQALRTLVLPDDRYVVPTFHYYEPFAFTSQGATWMPNAPPFGRAYGSAADKLQLDRDLAELRAYMARTGRVPVLGEYGAIDDPRLPLEQRVRYYRTISTAFASVGVDSCAWGYRNSFRLREGDRWVPGLIPAISTPTR